MIKYYIVEYYDLLYSRVERVRTRLFSLLHNIIKLICTLRDRYHIYNIIE